MLEDAVATVAGIDELRSISSDGMSMVMVTFRLERNIDAAVQDVRDAVSSVANRLPPGIDPPVVQKQDIDSSPIHDAGRFRAAIRRVNCTSWPIGT